MGRLPQRDDERHGRSGDSRGGGDVGGPLGELVLELLDVPEGPALDCGIVEERDSDGGDSSRVLAADGRLPGLSPGHVGWWARMATYGFF